jgi:hypothetical protein
MAPQPDLTFDHVTPTPAPRGEAVGVPQGDTTPHAPTVRQLPLFPGVGGPRSEEGPSNDDADGPFAEAAPAGTDSRQLDLFSDHAMLARDLDDAIAAGRFEEAVRLRLSMDTTFGPSETSRCLAPLDRLAGVAWEGPPGMPLTVWAEIDRQLGDQRPLRERLRMGTFIRLLQSHTPRELLAARPECLPALVHVLSGPGRTPEEGRLEARVLVRDSLLAGRTLDALDFPEDEALADLLAEDEPPQWLACLGRIRRLWPSSPLGDSEWEAMGAVARGEAGNDEPGTAFWQCLRVAESPDCPDDLRHQARRRMKQLHPDLHALFMRRAAPG